MPAADADLEERSISPEPITRLPFPPVTKSHILHCSYHFWHPMYRSLTPKARLIPLPPAFLTYLRSDGIVLPSEEAPPPSPLDNDDDSGIFSSTDSENEEEEEEAENTDPSLAWPDVHQKIKATIAELGGSVVPKLNWSAPKDATWINATNSMECRSPNDIYLLLKSSDFITHDLEQAFDGCCDPPSSSSTPTAIAETTNVPLPSSTNSIPYTLTLRKTIPSLNPACEFRCFVRNRTLQCLCQRDLNHYDFLFPMVPHLRSLIQTFFDEKLAATFPDASFVFDVYIPPPHRRVWLIDVNPWAPRTDPLLFSWLEILNTRGFLGTGGVRGDMSGLMTVQGLDRHSPHSRSGSASNDDDDDDDENSDTDSKEEEEEELPFLPEVRLVKKDDPEAYSFTSPQYSAHKLPKDVVDASLGGVEGEGGLREFMGRWRDIVRRQEAEDDEGSE